MLPVNTVGMFMIFTKTSKMVNPNQIQTQAGYLQRLKGLRARALLMGCLDRNEEDIVLINMSLSFPYATRCSWKLTHD